MPKFHKKITDLIEPQKLYQLQQRVSQSSHVNAIILDHLGRPVTPLCELAEFCPRRRETAGASCQSLHTRLFAEACASKQPTLGLCEHSNLAAAALPVYSEGELICVWLLCQFHFDGGGQPQCPETPLEREQIAVLNQSSLDLLVNFITLLTEDVLQLRQYNIIVNKMQEKAHQLAYQDRLLGLPNSLSMEHDLQDYSGYRYLIILDVIDLRKINDVYGRDCGDALLCAIRDYILKLHIPDSCLYHLDVADFGLLVERNDAAYARQLAQQLHDHCSSAWQLQLDDRLQEVFISVNVGVLPVDHSYHKAFGMLSSSIEHTLDAAQRAEGIALFNDNENQNFRNRIRLEMCLRQATRDQMRGFYLVYQPIIDPGVALWRGVEALCRWHNAEFGVVAPNEFIPIAENCGLINELGLWVLREALRQMKELELDKAPNFVLDVNLSPIQLTDPDLAEKVIQILREYDYPATKLCLEITESNEFNFSKHALRIMHQLSEAGVQIALDDFGAGYASFYSLSKLPVQILKTDRSLIHNVENDSFLKRLFYVMVEMAHAAGMKIVAEGVETDSQALLLMKEGADYFQGYKFAYPLTFEDLANYVENFHSPSGELVAMGYARIDLSRLSDEQGGYELTPSLYKLLSRCMQVLLSLPDGNLAINTALALIGQELGVSRSYVFLRESDGTFSNTHEWCAPGIAPEKHNLQHADITRISPGWVKALTENGMLVASDIRMLDEGAFGVLIAQGIKAVVEFPFWEEGKLSGFVGFDDCRAIHYWTREEIQMLHTLTGIISSTLGKAQLQDQLGQQNQRIVSMLNHMDTAIYVSDLETDEILFANTELKESFGGEELEGQVCWKALQNQEQRCSFCPIPKIQLNPGETYHWEFFNEKLGAYFRISDSIIPWDNDRLVHFEYAINITELKKYQMRLEEYASIDMLTKALNRNGFAISARNALKQAHLNEHHVTLAFIDIDGLKQENDQCGHAAGDAMIRTIVQTLRRKIRSTDLIGRFGGDEFVLLFYDCLPEYAERSLRAAAQELEQFTQEQEGHRPYSFSYGLVDNSEIDYNASDDYLNQLISTADLRMIEHKRERRRHRPE